LVINKDIVTKVMDEFSKIRKGYDGHLTIEQTLYNINWDNI